MFLIFCEELQSNFRFVFIYNKTTISIDLFFILFGFCKNKIVHRGNNVNEQ